MRQYNTLTASECQNPTSKDLSFKNCLGEDAPSPPPSTRTTKGSLYLEPPLLKSCICSRMVCHNPDQKDSDTSLFSCFFMWQLLVINNLHTCK